MPRAKRRTLVTAILLAGVSTCAPAWVHASPPEGVDVETATKQQAKAEVAAASAAFSAGDYALALDHYAAAMALRPAPKLHYNLAVCHQRLSLQSEDPEARTRHRELAIDSYNSYLSENPEAEDRLEVAAVVRELGGTPVTLTPIKPVFETDPPEDPDPELEPEPEPEPEPIPEPKPLLPPNHGRFGILLGAGLGSSLIRNDLVAARGLFLIDLHGGGFVGPKRRFLLAAHTTIYTGLSLRTDRLNFWALHVGLLAEQQWVVAHERLAIGLGGVIGYASQTVVSGVNAAPPSCTLGDKSVVANRNGGEFGARFDLSILVGPRRRGMLMVMLQPTVDVFGRPKSGDMCAAGESPWDALGIAERWQFLVFGGAGYSLRF